MLSDVSIEEMVQHFTPNLLEMFLKIIVAIEIVIHINECSSQQCYTFWVHLNAR